MDHTIKQLQPVSYHDFREVLGRVATTKIKQRQNHTLVYDGNKRLVAALARPVFNRHGRSQASYFVRLT